MTPPWDSIIQSLFAEAIPILLAVALVMVIGHHIMAEMQRQHTEAIHILTEAFQQRSTSIERENEKILVAMVDILAELSNTRIDNSKTISALIQVIDDG